jgi:hypothetical protein
MGPKHVWARLTRAAGWCALCSLAVAACIDGDPGWKVWAQNESSRDVIVELVPYVSPIAIRLSPHEDVDVDGYFGKVPPEGTRLNIYGADCSSIASVPIGAQFSLVVINDAGASARVVDWRRGSSGSRTLVPRCDGAGASTASAVKAP